MNVFTGGYYRKRDEFSHSVMIYVIFGSLLLCTIIMVLLSVLFILHKSKQHHNGIAQQNIYDDVKEVDKFTEVNVCKNVAYGNVSVNMHQFDVYP